MGATNPFKEISDMYNEQVAEKDALGYSQLFMTCTDKFFSIINRYFESDNQHVHFSDVKYLDGYYIFGSGSNSVVHFHIDECPGWLFGIWWSFPGDKENRRSINGDFFAQYEENIDKFKPSASVCCESIQIYPEDKPDNGCVGFARDVIRFIINEPYLAFCRDYCYWNYNYEYHTKEEAEAVYNKFRAQRDNENKYTKIFDDDVFKFIDEKIIPLFIDAKIEDMGANWYPRYELKAPYSKNTEYVERVGCYDLFGVIFGDEDSDEKSELSNEFYDIISRNEKRAEDLGFIWDAPLQSDIFFCREDAYDDE